MFIASLVAAVTLFAAPESTQSGAPAEAKAATPAAAATADAKPATKRVCEIVEVSGSNLPKKKCRDVPVKADAKPTEEAKADTPKAQ